MCTRLWNNRLELQLQTLPEGPGVYQYYDKDGKILYVGKSQKPQKKSGFLFYKNPRQREDACAGQKNCLI